MLLYFHLKATLHYITYEGNTTKIARRDTQIHHVKVRNSLGLFQKSIDSLKYKRDFLKNEERI